MAEHNPLLRLWSLGFKALLLVILAIVAWPLALIWAVVGTLLVVRDLREQAERRQALQHLVRPLAPPPQQPYIQWDAQRGHFERPPLPEAQHRLDLWESGTFVGATVVCLGGPDHECRWWCDEDTGCEQCGPGGEHRWAPIAYCRIADWINNCGIDDTHDENEDLPWDEDGEGQSGIRSGVIETEWTGDDYIWRYADDETGR